GSGDFNYVDYRLKVGRPTPQGPGFRMGKLRRDFLRHGFAIVAHLLALDDIAALRDESDRLLAGSPHRAGVRNALATSPLLAELATSGFPAAVGRQILGVAAVPTKLTLFDKTPDANWKVPWHQDLTICVRERREAPGFGAWSVKDGVPHVQP